MSTVTPTVSGSIPARGPSAPAPSAAPPTPTRCQQAILCEVLDGGIGVIFQQPVASGERFSLPIAQWLPGSDRVIELEAAWCAGLRAGLRLMEAGSPDEARLLRTLQGWLLEGGRWLPLAPAVVEPEVEREPMSTAASEERAGAAAPLSPILQNAY